MIEAPTGTLPERLGFRTGARGTHSSRTIMLAELRDLLKATAPDASVRDYVEAIVDDNALAKETASGRRLTAKRLGELYALDPRIPLFRHLRFFWRFEDDSHPLLACLCASARDPLFRDTASCVLSARQGEVVSRTDLEEVIETASPDRFSPVTRRSIAQRALSSWTQSGHLEGRRVKRRRRPVVTPASTVYALLLGYSTGLRGPLLFDTFWARLLDAPAENLHALSVEASKREWIDYKRLGTVVEVSFNGLLTRREKVSLHG